MGMLDEDPKNMTQVELLQWNLVRAEQHCSQALKLLYDPVGVRRGFWFRRRILLSQNHLMTLVVRELRRRHD